MDGRWIEFEGIRNARTLEGLISADGRRVRRGLLRTGKLCAATKTDIDALAERWQLRMVVDLRTTPERMQEPDPAVPGAERREIPVFDDRVIGVTHEKDGESPRVLPPPPDMERVYRRMVYDPMCRENLGRSTRAVLEHDFSQGCVLWHCSEGKDRCGLLAMTVLAALGVDRATIMEDYMLTNVFSAPKAEQFYQEMLEKGRSPEEAAGVRRGMRAERSYLEAAFAAIDELCGDLPRYLTEGLGIPSDTIRDFRERMLE